MMNIKVQHEDPSIQTSPLLIVPFTVIPETSTAPATTIPPPIPLFISLQQQSTPILTPTTTKATTSTTIVLDFETLSAIHIRLLDLEKEVKELKNVDHSLTLRATIKSEVSATIKEYLGTSLDDALYKDEDVMDTGVADKSKKRKPDDADRDEGPLAGPDQGTSKGTTKSQPKFTGKSAQTKETVFEAGDNQVPHNLGEDMCNTDEQPIVNVDPRDWFKKLERPLTQDPKWNECKTVDNNPTQKWLSDLTKAETSSKTFDDLISTLIDFNAFLKSTCRSYIELEYNMEECYKALTDQLDWNNHEGDRYAFDLSKPLPLVQSRNPQMSS
ncbi:hypothetical protein Tco_0269522 [Tanacetum coccineum]